MENEIKIGDRVRVSKDAPKMFVCGFNHVYTAYISKVLEVEDGNAIIEMTMANMQCQERIIIPLKYLVKVDAEAKEAKFKYQVGQKVKSVYDDEILTIKECCGRVGHDNVYRVEEYTYAWSECELKPYTATTEQTEADKTQNATASELRDLANHGVAVGGEVKRRIKERDEKPNAGSIKIPVEVDLTDSYWDAYAADLAKEIVLKTVNFASDRRPSVIAEYATDVAKAVVEGLKRK